MIDLPSTNFVKCNQSFIALAGGLRKRCIRDENWLVKMIGVAKQQFIFISKKSKLLSLSLLTQSISCTPHEWLTPLYSLGFEPFFHHFVPSFSQLLSSSLLLILILLLADSSYPNHFWVYSVNLSTIILSSY